LRQRRNGYRAARGKLVIISDVIRGIVIGQMVHFKAWTLIWRIPAWGGRFSEAAAAANHTATLNWFLQ
jgi:hypothetical protein